MKTKILKHVPSGGILYGGAFVDLPEKPEIELLGEMRDIQLGGRYSEGIIDTSYHSPEDYGKEDWDDDDDTTDDYVEEELDIPTDAIYVRYYNFRPDYSLVGNRGGYCEWFETFENLEDAKDFLKNLEDEYRGEILE